MSVDNVPALIDRKLNNTVVYHTLGKILFVAHCFGFVTFVLKSSCNSSLRLLFVQLFKKIDNNTFYF